MKRGVKIGLAALLLAAIAAAALWLPRGAGSSSTELVDLAVVHDWLSQEPGGKPADEVLVQLLRDGKPYGDPVALDAGHGWEHYWKDLDGGHEWTVARASELPGSYGYQPDAAYGEYVREADGKRHRYVVCSMVAADGTCSGAPPQDRPMSVHEIWFGDEADRPAHVLLSLNFDGGSGNPLDAVSLSDLNGWRYLLRCSGAYDRDFGEHLTDAEWRSMAARRLADGGYAVEYQLDGSGSGDDGDGYGRVVVEHFWEQRDTGGVQSARVIANVPA